MKTHELKILPEYFEDVTKGTKNFELRRNDRDFAVGDKLILKEYEEDAYTGRETTRVIEYIFRGGSYGLDPEYSILGTKPCNMSYYEERGVKA